MKTVLKYLALGAVVSLLGAAFYLKVYTPKTTYKIISPTQGDLKVSITGIGNVSAEDIYSITAQSGGQIVNIFTDSGKWVKKGDLLILMDGVDLPDQLEIAHATLQKSQFELVASRNELKSQLTQKELLRKTYERYSKLNEQGYAAQSEYDKALADLQSIEANILVSKSHINSSKVQILLSKKSKHAIKTKIDNLKVYAPVDGYVISKEAQLAQNVLPTTPILKIVDAKTLWIEAKIDERISANIKIGQESDIVLSSQPKKIYKGIVKKIAPMSDLVTLEKEIDIAFVSIPEPFFINEQAEVSIHTREFQNILKIPLNVLVQNDGNIGVWVAKNSHAHFQVVQKIAQDDNFMAILNLDINTQIIVPDATKKSLKEGMKIHL